MMNNIFQDLIAEGVVCVYLDDILIYTKMLEEYHCITHLILECLHQHQLYLKLEKCEFEQTQIEYLGLIISHGVGEMDPVKVAGVDFLHHACLLFDLTRKDIVWSWGPLEQMAFDALKHAMTSGPIFLFLENNCPFWVEANSSNFTTGAILLQQSLEDGKWHSVAFFSKSLNAIEQNYKIHNKEMLAIIQSFEEWQHFLEGAWHEFKELEQYLCLFCNKCQDDWDELLPNAEFQYNDYIHASIQFSPFFLDTGQYPCMGFKPWAQPSENEAVNKFVDWMKKLQEEA
ncbi:hypothetical protein E4T56_gene9797 [Termitomyces sp. T112]|nr:hypothetical protein E4T56_gene9797 [Termitomyces sp. T112]